MFVNLIAAKYSGDGAKPGVLTICGEHEWSARGAPEIAKDVRGAIPEVRGVDGTGAREKPGSEDTSNGGEGGRPGVATMEPSWSIGDDMGTRGSPSNLRSSGADFWKSRAAITKNFKKYLQERTTTTR
jgi:hypothetical protein